MFTSKQYQVPVMHTVLVLSVLASNCNSYSHNPHGTGYSVSRYPVPNEQILPHVLKYEDLTGTPVLTRVSLEITEFPKSQETGIENTRVGECKLWALFPIKLDVPPSREPSSSEIRNSVQGNVLLRREIKLDPDFWNSESYLMREQLVFHELGHCIHLQGHTQDGLMAPTLNSEYASNPEFRSQILEQFINQIKE
jgi:hypothetical protein